MKKTIAILVCCVVFLTGASRSLFAAPKPSIDGRAVVADSGVLPKGAYGKSVGYLPGDSVTVTNPAAGVSIDVMILGVIDSTEGIAILLSPEAADSLFISKDTQTLVTITKKGMITDMPETAAETKTKTAKADPDKDARKAIPDGIAQKFEPGASSSAAEQPFPIAPPVLEPAADTRTSERAAAPSASADSRITELGENFDWIWLYENASPKTVAPNETKPEITSAKPVPENPAAVPFSPESPSPAESGHGNTVIAESGASKNGSSVGNTLPLQNDALAEISPPPQTSAPAEISPSPKNNASAETSSPQKNNASAETSSPQKNNASAETSSPQKNNASAETSPSQKNNTPVVETAPPAAANDEQESIVLLVPSGPKPPVTQETFPRPNTSAAQQQPKTPVTSSGGAGANSSGIPSEKPAREETFAVPSVARIQSLERGKYYVQIATFSSAESVRAIAMKYGDNYPLVQIVNEKSSQLLVGPLNADEYGAVLAHFREYGYKDAYLRAGGK
ncbi:MAG: hypothetical protein Pg6C_13270 [Treponemataceae bacterium]|nr:MAG: hypothetical protein Pg6C_13270 [Treponemataceae bacterium]